VLASALFGGALLVGNVEEVRRLKRVGLSAVLATGALLFVSAPVRYYESTSFRIKMVLLVLALVSSVPSLRRNGIALALWAAVIFAARGIAFF
jgi:hypothetical protein